MAGSIGRQWGVLKRQITGDPEEAEQNLLSRSPTARLLQQRAENRSRNRMKKKATRLGQRPSIRTAV